MSRATRDRTEEVATRPEPARVAVTLDPRRERVLELQRAVGNRATTGLLLRQPTTTTPPPPPQTAPPPPPAPRRDFVFLMGADRAGDPNQFYHAARRYWTAHLPNATLVDNQRSLVDLLSWINANVTTSAPVGQMIVVSHANEDGTLSFGLDAADPDHHLSFPELRGAVTGGTLPQLAGQIDAQSQIHIKGCDIGRSQQMIDMVGQAFGNQAVVTAPTHEQGYGFDSALRDRAITDARASIWAHVEAAHPEPPAVDPTLTGRDRAAAVRERARAMTQRRRAIAADMATHAAEISAAGEVTGTIEEFSGPMFQRPGGQVYTRDELRAEVDRLYPHLSDDERASLARRLAAADRRTAAQQRAQGTFSQQGQRVDRRTQSFTFPEPRTIAEVQRIYGAGFRTDHFTPRAISTNERQPQTGGGFRVHTVVEGRFTVPHEDPQDGHEDLDAPVDDAGNAAVVPDDATLLAQARANVASPDKFTWTVEETHATTGMTTRTAVGVRVIAYLHHGSLNVTEHEHFTAPLTDTRFYAVSHPTPAAAPATTGSGAPAHP